VKVIAISFGVLAACGGGGGGDPPDADPSAPDARDPGRCDDGDRVGQMRLTPEPGQTERFGSQIGGWFADVRAPEFVAPVDEAGGCRYLAVSPALCNPTCEYGEVCDVHGACVPFPTTLDAGTVRVTTPVRTVTLEPQAGNGYYAQMPYPGLYAPGDPLSLDVEGSAGFAPVQLETIGLPAISLPATMLTATEHQDFVIAWDPVTGIAGAEVRVELHNDHHAGPEYIECTADASLGSLTVPSSILDQLILAGENGIGTYIESAFIEQRRRAYATTAQGCVAFDAATDRFLQIETIRAP
jgi:hypothetical protein